MLSKPFSAYSGSRSPKLVIVAEAWGEDEESMKMPLVGASGKELWRMLGEAMPELHPELWREAESKLNYGLLWTKHRRDWLEAAGIGMTNVFNLRPPGNKIEELCGKKAEVSPGYSLPPLRQGKYIRDEFLGELQRLKDELSELKPNLVLALGNTASWALLKATNIGSIRGTVAHSPLDFGRNSALKILPTYHPAAILRQWSQRVVVVADLMKAGREMEFLELRRPRRWITVSPSIEEVEAQTQHILELRPKMLACDIETEKGQITCISFAWARDKALVIPFAWFRATVQDMEKTPWLFQTASYWKTEEEEIRAWRCVGALLESEIPKLFQNGVYDLQYLMKFPFRPRAVEEDTMLLHHALYPELRKGLGFLGSVYTNEASWKLMRKEKADTEKRDE